RHSLASRTLTGRREAHRSEDILPPISFLVITTAGCYATGEVSATESSCFLPKNVNIQHSPAYRVVVGEAPGHLVTTAATKPREKSVGPGDRPPPFEQTRCRGCFVLAEREHSLGVHYWTLHGPWS
ncbi:unnamed protein product, partial [Soboliphyme baturini]|uniref:C2H2-type domain-containing protein n=1 Tax=Soboliphyme baturini TaxID=241478 RepID=A0A183IVP4_9BILA